MGRVVSGFRFLPRRFDDDNNIVIAFVTTTKTPFRPSPPLHSSHVRFYSTTRYIARCVIPFFTHTRSGLVRCSSLRSFSARVKISLCQSPYEWIDAFYRSQKHVSSVLSFDFRFFDRRNLSPGSQLVRFAFVSILIFSHCCSPPAIPVQGRFDFSTLSTCVCFRLSFTRARYRQVRQNVRFHQSILRMRQLFLKHTHNIAGIRTHFSMIVSFFMTIPCVIEYVL